MYGRSPIPRPALTITNRVSSFADLAFGRKQLLPPAVVFCYTFGMKQRVSVVVAVLVVAGTGWYFGFRSLPASENANDQSPIADSACQTDGQCQQELEMDKAICVDGRCREAAEGDSEPTLTETLTKTNTLVRGVCLPTSARTEGPYYKAGAPVRQEIRTDETVGFPITVTGKVLDASCQPINGAVLDFWQADGNGAYDNAGFGLRGQQTTGQDGVYTLYTVIPGQYPGRTEHLHVKVRRPDGVVLTTQLFFPLSGTNATDTIFDSSLVVQQFADENLATFDFIVP